MNLLKRGKSFFFAGGAIFFPGFTILGILLTYGKTGETYMGIGIAISGICIMLGLPMLMLAGALLSKNRRMV